MTDLFEEPRKQNWIVWLHTLHNMPKLHIRKTHSKGPHNMLWWQYDFPESMSFFLWSIFRAFLVSCISFYTFSSVYFNCCWKLGLNGQTDRLTGGHSLSQPKMCFVLIYWCVIIQGLNQTDHKAGLPSHFSASSVVQVGIIRPSTFQLSNFRSYCFAAILVP